MKPISAKIPKDAVDSQQEWDIKEYNTRRLSAERSEKCDIKHNG